MGFPHTFEFTLVAPEVSPIIPVQRTVNGREFWLRANKNAEPFGPFTYYEADGLARSLTREAARTRQGDISLELITYVGSRPGDPPVEIHPTVVYIYLAGRKTQGGSLAAYNSRRGNT